jgi:hypothetical protein
MAGSLTDIQATIQQAVIAINRLAKQVSTTFPQASSASSAVRGSVGSVTFTSSQAIGFFPVTTSSGSVAYVALYPSS